MLMNRMETVLVNSPPRRALQRFYEARLLIDLGGRTPGATVAEIGCGSGYGTKLIVDRFGAAGVDAVDLDPGMIQRAHRRLEAGDLNTAAAALADQGVQFLGIDIRDTRDGGRDFYDTFDVTYPSIFDPTMQTLLSLRGYPASAIPSTMVVDRTGRVAHIWLRRVTANELIVAITPIAAEAG